MPRDLANQIRVERVRDVFGRPGTPIYAASLILSGIAIETALMAWLIVDSWLPFVWGAGLVALQGCVALFVRSFHRHPRSDDEIPSWGRRKVLQEALHGLGWALCIPLIYTGSDLSLIVAMVTLVALVSAAAPGYAVHLPTAASFLSSALLPAAAILFAHPSNSAFYAGLMLLVTFTLSLANAVRWSAIYLESIQLRLDLAAGIDERRQLFEAADEGRRLAEAATAERTRFFGAASHDLRQPVHALGLYAALLRADPPKAERRELIHSIIACVANLERLFNAILDLSRPARATSEHQAFALDELIAATVIKFHPEAQQRGLSIGTVPTAAWAFGDPAAIERILGNLVSNAVRYTRSGGVLIRVRQVGQTVAISVADAGPGISAADRERIFDPFYRSSGEAIDKGGGMGLGLATVRELCRTHGHRLAVRSKTGRGSLFRLSLRAAPPQRQPNHITSEAVIGDGLDVLMVEDDPHVADAASRLLASWGVTVAVCRNGKQACELISSRPDARWHVLLDYRLPDDESGLAVADHMRARFGRALPITLVTGEADPALFAAAAARDLPVLRKPLSPIRLRTRLAATAA